jgi:hypothetical protein
MNNLNNEDNNSLYYGSNEHLQEVYDNIGRLLEFRKSYKYELVFRVMLEQNGVLEIKSSSYLNDLSELKNNPKALMKYNGHYFLYKVFLRRLTDNYIIMIGEKNKSSLLELTENFFKLKD